MKMAILGSGNVGSTLGKRFAGLGHEIVYGTRDPQSVKIKQLIQSIGPSAQALNSFEAVRYAEIVILAVPWHSALDIIRGCGPWEGKILIDCTNPLKKDLSGLELLGVSAAHQIAQLAKGAKIIKAFNTTGSKNMENPVFGGEKSVMFVCGDDKPSKSKVMGLVDDIGFEAVDAGGLESAPYLEALAMLWIRLAVHQGMGVDFAIKILRR